MKRFELDEEVDWDEEEFEGVCNWEVNWGLDEILHTDSFPVKSPA